MLVEADLPDDPALLRAMLVAARGEIAQQQALIADLEGAGTDARAEIERLTAIIAAFQRHRFGVRSEQLDPDQLALALEELDAAVARVRAGLGATGDKPRALRTRDNNRGRLPAHLERIEQVVDVESKACACCGDALHVIGEDVAERLDVVPATFRVLVTRRPRYGCRACEAAPVQAPAPARIVEGGLPTEALIAHVLVAKYADHLPLYRQAQIYARQGVTLDRSTLADWVGRAAWWLTPLRDHLLADLKRSPRLFADETTAPVLDPGRGRTKTGQLWAYARDDRPWGGADPPAVAYVYAPDRKGERPAEHLRGFAGVLQVDGYAGYRALGRSNQVQLAFCWAHLWMPPLLQGLFASFRRSSRLHSSIRPVVAKRPASPALMVDSPAGSQSRRASSRLDAPNGFAPAPIRRCRHHAQIGPRIRVSPEEPNRLFC